MLAAVLNLLFIGNSLTAANDLPGLIEAMARASGISIRCTVVAKPDFSLEDHWTDGEARRAIARGGWSHVILQQGPSALPESRMLLEDFARRFDRDVRRAHARSAFFMVWPPAARRGDFDRVSASYAGAAAVASGLLLPAGDAWREAWRREPGLALYGPDGFHPSLEGSYLAALTIFYGLTGRLPPAGDVRGVPAADLEVMRAAVIAATARKR